MSVLFAVWAVGIPAVAAGMWHVAKHDAWSGSVFTANPAVACLITAIVAVCWPFAFAVGGLVHLMRRGVR